MSLKADRQAARSPPVSRPCVATPSAVLTTWRNLHLANAIICEELNARLAAAVGCSLIEHDSTYGGECAPFLLRRSRPEPVR